MAANAPISSNAAIAAVAEPAQAANVEPLAYSVPEAAKRLMVSASTMWAAISEGRVRVINIGRRRLIPREEVERIAREGTGGPLQSTARPRPAAVAKGA